MIVQPSEVRNEDIGESEDPGPNFSANVGSRLPRSLLLDVIAHLFPGGTSLTGEFLSKSLAEYVDLLAKLTPVDDTYRSCGHAVFPKKRRLPDPSALRGVPEVIEVHLSEVGVVGLDCDVSAGRLLLVVIIAIVEAAPVELLVAPVPQMAPLADLGRGEVRAIGLPDVIVVGTSGALVATPVVYVAPIVDPIGVNREHVVDREELATEGTIEGAAVDIIGVVGGVEELEVMLHPLDRPPVFIVDDRSPVATQESHRQAILIDVFPGELLSPNHGELCIGGVGEVSSKSPDAGPLGGSLEGHDLEDSLGRSIFVESSLLLLSSAFFGVGVDALDVLGQGHDADDPPR